ncbi:hypothetical protein D3C71_2013870 [compost metagenome]
MLRPKIGFVCGGVLARPREFFRRPVAGQRRGNMPGRILEERGYCFQITSIEPIGIGMDQARDLAFSLAVAFTRNHRRGLSLQSLNS